jgi:flagellar hook-length control protein FliK
MTMMLNTVIQTTALASGTAAAAAPARNADAGLPAPVQIQGQGQAPADALDAAAQAPAPQPFAAWLGEQFQSAALALQAAPQAASAGDDAAAPAPKATSAAPDDAAGDAASAAPLPQDGALLAAMAAPLMPLSPAQVAQAVQAAQPTGSQPGDAGKPAADVPAVSATTDRAAGVNGGRPAAAPDRGLVLPQAAAAPLAEPAKAAPGPHLAVDAQAAVVRQSGAAGTGTGAGTPDRGDRGAEHTGAGAGNTGNGGNAASAAAMVGAAAAQPATGAPAADTVKLAGPPTAWRQSLQEALGERMNVQVGKGIEQAVIRLEPPQLGRIDIAIRHSAGTLEVNISATNGEVLRQLQTVSDNLRSDLSQRQFTEVAVTVAPAPAPKNGAAPFGDPQQGRGRQQDREQEDKQPGRALAEADNNSSGFSLGGREYA